MVLLLMPLLLRTQRQPNQPHIHGPDVVNRTKKPCFFGHRPSKHAFYLHILATDDCASHWAHGVVLILWHGNGGILNLNPPSFDTPTINGKNGIMTLHHTGLYNFTAATRSLQPCHLMLFEFLYNTTLASYEPPLLTTPHP